MAIISGLVKGFRIMQLNEKIRLIADGEFEVVAKLSVDEITDICRNLRGTRVGQINAELDNQEISLELDQMRENYAHLELERDGFKSELQKARSQEPDAWRITAKAFCGLVTNDKELADHWLQKGEAYPLYALLPVPAQQVPEGWRRVPIEPTKEMIISGIEAHLQGAPGLEDPEYIRQIFKAMLSAAPDSGVV